MFEGIFGCPEPPWVVLHEAHVTDDDDDELNLFKTLETMLDIGLEGVIAGRCESCL